MKLFITLGLLLGLSVGMASAETVELTAYTHTGGVMANGEYPYVGAVASNDYPLGTTIYIYGQPYVVADRMASGIHGVIDVFVDSYDEAIAFGRQTAEVYTA